MDPNREDEKKLDMPRSGLVATIGIIILGIYDLVTVLVKGTTSSVSQFLINAGLSPLVSFAFGFVGGHLFGYMYLMTGPMNCQSVFVQTWHYRMVGFYIGSIFCFAVNVIYKRIYPKLPSGS